MRSCPVCGAEDVPLSDQYMLNCSRCGTLLRVDLTEVIVVPEWTEDCPCHKEKCERHNKCKECHDHHHFKNGRLPRCIRKRKKELTRRLDN